MTDTDTKWHTKHMKWHEMTPNDNKNYWIYPNLPRAAVQLSTRVCCWKINEIVPNVVVSLPQKVCAAEKKMSAAKELPKSKCVLPKTQYVAKLLQTASTVCVAEKWIRVTWNRGTKFLTKFGTKSVTKSYDDMHHYFVNHLLHPSHWLCPN